MGMKGDDLLTDRVALLMWGYVCMWLLVEMVVLMVFVVWQECRKRKVDDV